MGKSARVGNHMDKFSDYLRSQNKFISGIEGFVP